MNFVGETTNIRRSIEQSITTHAWISTIKRLNATYILQLTSFISHNLGIIAKDKCVTVIILTIQVNIKYVLVDWFLNSALLKMMFKIMLLKNPHTNCIGKITIEN
jgi:hypothetical protein